MKYLYHDLNWNIILFIKLHFLINTKHKLYYKMYMVTNLKTNIIKKYKIHYMINNLIII